MRKKTHEEFIQEVYNLVGDEYEVLTPYECANKPIQMKHECGCIYPVRPSNFLSGKRCPECYKARQNQDKQKSPTVFEKQFKEKYHGQFELKSTYTGAFDKVEVLCLSCQNTFPMSATQLLRYNQTCPNCRNFIRNTTAFKHKVYELVGEEYTVLGEYQGHKKHVLMRHESCGHEWRVRPINFLSAGSRCPNCKRNRRIKHEEFVEQIRELVGDEYTVLTEYQGTRKGVLMKHNLCTHEWWVAPASFKAGTRCPQCSNREVTINNCLQTCYPEVAKEWHPERNGDKTPLDYVGTSRQKVWWLCQNCGNEWLNRIDARTLLDRDCPECGRNYNKSRGELYIKQCLKEWGIPFKTQYVYTDCRNKAALQFDIAVLDEKQQVRCLIEFDGEQHFYPIERFGGEEGFEATKENDEIKNNYCKNHDIILIRIPYWLRKHVEEVLRYWLEYYQIL